MAYWLALTYPWGYRIYTCVIQSDLSVTVQNQAQCNALKEPYCPLTTQLNTGSWFITLIDFSSGGYIIMVCLCSSEVFKFWTKVYNMMYNKPFAEGLYQVRVSDGI
jgi:hypothetical protein